MRRRSGDKLVKDVGRRIAELRRLRRESQEALAERIGVSARYVQEVEAGVENLTLRTLARLGEVLGVDAAELLKAPQRKTGGPVQRTKKKAVRRSR